MPACYSLHHVHQLDINIFLETKLSFSCLPLMYCVREMDTPSHYSTSSLEKEVKEMNFLDEVKLELLNEEIDKNKDMKIFRSNDKEEKEGKLEKVKLRKIRKRWRVYVKLIKIGNHSGDKKRKPTHKKHSINKMRSQYKYDGDDVIGEGGFGKVLAGERINDGEPVAIKFIPKDKVLEWSTLYGMKVPMELKLLHCLKKVKGVIKLLDYFEKEDAFIIVMKRPVSCIDMFEYINEKEYLDEKIATDFFHQVVETVLSCHSKGIIHRDIKDENILVDLVTGKLKLIDFGCGSLLKEESFPTFQGTEAYAPPEWLMSGIYLPGPATVWTLGMLLYDMICGDIPWEEEDEICAAQIRFRVPVSTECEDLIRSCLKIRPKDRISLDNILQHPWMYSG